MSSRVAASLMLAAFVLFSVSCKTWGMRNVETLVQRLPENTPVLKVVKKTGDVVVFSKLNPGRVRGYAIVGTGRDAVMKRLDLTGPFSLIKERDDGTVSEVIDAKGRVYFVQQVLGQNANQMTVMAAEVAQLSIPLAEAREIEVKKGNAFLTTLAVVGGAAGGLFLILAMTLGID